MQPETAPAIDPQPAGMSEISRIVGVFFEPKKAFADIAARPRWIVPVLLIAILSMCTTYMYSQRGGWRVMIQQQMANSSRQPQGTPEQQQQSIEMGVKVASIIGYVIPLIIPVMFLIVAGVLTGITAGILSAPVKFFQVFAIVCYANLPGIVSGVLVMVVMQMKNLADFNLSNPLMFNPGAFMDPKESSKFLYSLATSLDLFSFWVMLLIATGLKAAAGKKLSFGGAFFAVVLPWAVYVLCKSAMAGMFG
jgi:Yip1 domain